MGRSETSGIDLDSVRRAGELRAELLRVGKSPSASDVMIAGHAVAGGHTLVTRYRKLANAGLSLDLRVESFLLSPTSPGKVRSTGRVRGFLQSALGWIRKGSTSARTAVNGPWLAYTWRLPRCHSTTASAIAMAASPTIHKSDDDPNWNGAGATGS